MIVTTAPPPPLACPTASQVVEGHDTPLREPVPATGVTAPGDPPVTGTTTPVPSAASIPVAKHGPAGAHEILLSWWVPATSIGVPGAPFAIGTTTPPLLSNPTATQLLAVLHPI